MKKANLKIKRMHCPSCKMLIEEALLDLGVKSKVDINYQVQDVKV